MIDNCYRYIISTETYREKILSNQKDACKQRAVLAQKHVQLYVAVPKPSKSSLINRLALFPDVQVFHTSENIRKSPHCYCTSHCAFSPNEQNKDHSNVTKRLLHLSRKNRAGERRCLYQEARFIQALM